MITMIISIYLAVWMDAEHGSDLEMTKTMCVFLVHGMWLLAAVLVMLKHSCCKSAIPKPAAYDIELATFPPEDRAHTAPPVLVAAPGGIELELPTAWSSVDDPDSEDDAARTSAPVLSVAAVPIKVPFNPFPVLLGPAVPLTTFVDDVSESKVETNEPLLFSYIYIIVSLLFYLSPFSSLL